MGTQKKETQGKKEKKGAELYTEKEQVFRYNQDLPISSSGRSYRLVSIDRKESKQNKRVCVEKQTKRKSLANQVSNKPPSLH